MEAEILEFVHNTIIANIYLIIIKFFVIAIFCPVKIKSIIKILFFIIRISAK